MTTSQFQSTNQCIDGMNENGNPCPPQKSWYSYLNPFNLLGGGRKKTIKRGGGVIPYTDINSASTASRFSDGQTAQPHQWTGGKRRRRTKGKSKRRSFRCNKCSKRTRHRH